MTDTHPAEAEGNLLQDFVDDSSPEEMEEAKGLGWKSPADWKGDPPKNGFKKAKEYLEHGRTVLPIVQSENKKLKEELTTARRELAETKKDIAAKFENLERMSMAALDRQRKQLLESFEAVEDAAAEVGDKEALRKARTDKAKALDKFDEEVAERKEDKKADKPAGMPKEIEDWVKENPWFDDDEDMKAVAIRKHGELLNKHSDWSLEKNLAEVRKYVEKRFPSEFKKDEPEEDDDRPEKRKGSPVEGGGSRIGGGSQRSGWSRLPAEAQQQADKFIKGDGLFLEKGETIEKDLQKARERYAKQYHGEEA
jgi:ElaB/YqjD/DUF883 family membrane-anchored ribosome-binding protein